MNRCLKPMRGVFVDHSPDARPTEGNARRLVEAKVLMFILGTDMDHQTDVLKSGLVFNNPNQTSACGCCENLEIKPATA